MENNPAIKWVTEHPRFSAWVVLATGMVALLVVEARSVGLLPSQWVALIVATILVAGACIWIISWEDKDNPEDEAEVSAGRSRGRRPRRRRLSSLSPHSEFRRDDTGVPSRPHCCTPSWANTMTESQPFLARPDERYKESFIEATYEFIREKRTINWHPEILRGAL